MRGILLNIIQVRRMQIMINFLIHNFLIEFPAAYTLLSFYYLHFVQFGHSFFSLSLSRFFHFDQNCGTIGIFTRATQCQVPNGNAE